MYCSFTAFVSEPNSRNNQGSDGENSTLVANESGLNDTYNLGTTPNDTTGDNTWEVVSTSTEPATSIDGSANSSAEAFVVGTNNQHGSGFNRDSEQPGLTQHNMVRSKCR